MISINFAKLTNLAKIFIKLDNNYSMNTPQ